MSALSPTNSDLSSFVTPNDQDLIQELLADKRSANTRRAYQRDLKDFFNAVAGANPTPALVAEFLSLERFRAVSVVLEYKATLLEKGLAEATINRRLASIKALVDFARKIGKCDFTLQDIAGEKVHSYRDTTGISADSFKALLAIPNRSTLKGKRDYALLLLLWGNALRRGEVASANIEDLDLEAGTLKIRGKGRGTQAEMITLGMKAIFALSEWLEARGETDTRQPLFTSTHKGYWGERLSTTSIYKIVRKSAHRAGVEKVISPHRIRHSSITAALDKTDGNVRKVQKLSRHAKFETLMIYDDNRTNLQKEVTEVLDDLL